MKVINGGSVLIIRHNISSLNANNRLTQNNKKTNSVLEKLSSGYKINKAGDDAAGLAISEKMRGQIRGLNMAGKNIQDGISLLQTAEGALNEVHSLLQRMRELAIQAANDTSVYEDRLKIQHEINHLKNGIDEIANNTHFNTINLLNQKVSDITSPENPSDEVATKIISSLTYKPIYTVLANVNDTLEVEINGVSKVVQIPANTYSANNFIQELNNVFNNNQIDLTAKFSDKTNNIEFVSSNKNLIFNSIKGNIGANFLSPIISASNRTGNIKIDGYPTLNPGITITSGVNDTLTFDIDSQTYSITLSPGAYTIYGPNQSGQNINSQFINELNKQFTAAGAPVKAQFLYLRDSPPLDGTVLTLIASSDQDGLYQLTDGNHTFGNFGGNAKDTLFQNILDGWTLIDSSSLVNGSITSSNTTVQGRVDLSNGMNILSGENDTLNFDINGVTHSIVLSIGSYSPNQLINEINNQLINKGIDLFAEFDTSNHLVFTKHGDGIINNFSGNAVGELLFETKNLSFSIEKNPDESNQSSSPNGILHFQLGANSNQNMKINLCDVRISNLKLSDLDLTSQTSAGSAISIINKAIETVSLHRSEFGAYNNKLEQAMNNLSNTSNNLTQAESRIRDTDMAKEMMIFTKNNILLQAIQSMLAQSNKQPEGILQLLQ